MNKPTVKDLVEMKGKRQISQTTAHDYFTACACQAAHVDMIVTSGEFIRQYIAGDFVRTNETINDMLVALEGVRKGAPSSFIYTSIPHGLANISDAEAIRGAMEALRNGSDGIYYSGISLGRIRALAEQKVPVVGHAGNIPWHATWAGGNHAMGKTADDAYRIYQESIAMQDAGCFAIELECVPELVAREITKSLEILVISMGSGKYCDGQYLFSHDILGQHTNHYPRHSIVYAHQYDLACQAMSQYVLDVADGTLFEKQKLVSMPDREFELFYDKIQNLVMV